MFDFICKCGPIKGKSITVFENITVGPGENYDSVDPHDLDGYRYVNYWLFAGGRIMDDVTLQIVFEHHGMGCHALVNVENLEERNGVPTLVMARSGPNDIFGGFVLRSPVIGPAARAIVINNGPQTYQFSVHAYATL